MGRGNVCVFGDYEGLYYVDNDHLLVFRHKDDAEDTRLLGELEYGEMDTTWLYDEEGTMMQLEDLEECFCDMFGSRFRSFERCGDRNWITNSRRAILGFKLYMEQIGSLTIDCGRIDTGDVDSEIADCIIQLAVFGEVVYG